MSQSHGSPHAGYSFGQIRSKYKINTLVDISPTGIISEFREGVQMPFVDDLKQIINNQETWNVSRNEQRNWETIVQCISIRAQPIMLGTPVIEEITGVGGKGFGYTGKQKVWSFEFGFELGDIYATSDDPVGLLKEQLDLIPIVSNLKETISLPIPSLATTGDKVNTTCIAIDL
ncbi:MAG: hypothetical protein CMA64_09485 [Euryarchaeota archaeon]|jgi:hypothetical protein|nr:hypothetical protein [Euryarchaeota archaeon]